MIPDPVEFVSFLNFFFTGSLYFLNQNDKLLIMIAYNGMPRLSLLPGFIYIILNVNVFKQYVLYSKSCIQLRILFLIRIRLKACPDP